MKTAKVCETWKLTFNHFSDEKNVSLHNRSYLHYAFQHIELVAAKAWATKWLFENILPKDEKYSVREYMAGIGIQTLIIQQTFNLSNHIAGELDEGCVKHLSENEWKFPIIVKHQNANDAVLDKDTSDIKLLDLPNSSILQITTKWKDIFYKLFESNPKLIVWTDTSVTYPMSLHGEKYSKIFSENVTDKYEYVNAYSRWLYKNFGYSIKRAAFRGTNAVYFAALPRVHETETKSFPLKEYSNGFYFENENVNLESFFDA